MNPFKAVEDFHKKYKQDINEPFTEKNTDLRANLIYEEVKEFEREFIDPNSMEYFSKLPLEEIDKQNLTKELADIIYVAIGAAVTWGLPLEEVFKRTHESNMSKDGGFAPNGKVLKGPSYRPPVLGDLFDE